MAVSSKLPGDKSRGEEAYGSTFSWRELINLCGSAFFRLNRYQRKLSTCKFKSPLYCSRLHISSSSACTSSLSFAPDARLRVGSRSYELAYTSYFSVCLIK